MKKNIVKLTKNIHRSLYSLVILLAVFSLTSCKSVAQISSRIEESNGVSYYMHTVAPKQTLYSISKLYECDINEISASNPGVDDGLKEGQVVRIPVAKCKVKNKSVVEQNGKTFTLHTVQKKETLFSIAHSYGRDVNEIIAANPGADKGIKKGQELRIPAKKAEQKKEETKPPLVTTKHTVILGETLYSISKQYGVSVEEIQNANNGLNEGLKAGEVILIPSKDGFIPSATKPVAKDKRFGKQVLVEGAVFEEKYDIALMLPFYLSYDDTMEAREKKLREVAIQLYRGAMLAADSLEKMGLNAEVHVYDVIDEKGYISKLLENPEMKKMDLIIGPTSRDRISELNKWASVNGVHVVCPVQQPNNVLLTSPNMSKTVSSSVTMWSSMANFVYNKHKDDNIIIVDSKNIDDRKLVNSFKEEWKRLSGDTIKNIVVVNDASNFNVRDKYSATKNNIIIVPTSDKKVIGTLFKVLGEGNITVYGNESWDDMESISTGNRNKYHVHFPQTSYIHYSDTKVQKWIESYRRKFRSEPGTYSISGYDMLMFYGMGLKEYGRAFPNHFADIKVNTYGSDFDFFKTSDEGGFENKFVLVIGTENYELKRAQ
jgi:LysM repeat protein/ABC-type branched-subunit amino acid transport system substrate-binding protein